MLRYERERRGSDGSNRRDLNVSNADRKVEVSLW